MRYLFPVAALVALSSAALPARAQECSSCKDDGSTALTLSAEARRTVEQDRLMATLSFETTGKTPIEAQQKLNEKMQAARAVYSKVAGVKVTTGGYNTFKNYPPEPTSGWSAEERERKAFWQANQTLQLDGADRDALLKLAGALQQQGFAMQGMNFYLSREASDKLREDLTIEALKSIKDRAQAMGKALGMNKVRYVRIDTEGNMPRPMPYNMMRGEMAMMAKADAGMPEPVAQGGESDVEVRVTAEVKLNP